VAWPNDITEEEIWQEVDKWASHGVVSIKIKQATPGEAKSARCKPARNKHQQYQ